tara:strand:+ start:6155 stop:6373 length:219 start_codon:yes stop_codon:yes gene_type:complete
VAERYRRVIVHGGRVGSGWRVGKRTEREMSSVGILKGGIVRNQLVFYDVKPVVAPGVDVCWWRVVRGASAAS